MKIYTKHGDKGETSLISGERVSKSHLRLEAYGTVDELNAWMGVLATEGGLFDNENEIFKIQDRLFTIGALLAVGEDRETSKTLPKMKEADVKFLEDAIDKMNEDLPPMTHFVLPGSNSTNAKCHVARTVCRRAERYICALAEVSEVEELILKYINRLSDYLFVLGRYVCLTLKTEEKKWYPTKDV